MTEEMAEFRGRTRIRGALKRMGFSGSRRRNPVPAIDGVSVDGVGAVLDASEDIYGDLLMLVAESTGSFPEGKEVDYLLLAATIQAAKESGLSVEQGEAVFLASYESTAAATVKENLQGARDYIAKVIDGAEGVVEEGSPEEELVESLEDAEDAGMIELDFDNDRRNYQVRLK